MSLVLLLRGEALLLGHRDWQLTFWAKFWRSLFFFVHTRSLKNTYLIHRSRKLRFLRYFLSTHGGSSISCEGNLLRCVWLVR
jgi:hypothetical protein